MIYTNCWAVLVGNFMQMCILWFNWKKHENTMTFETDLACRHPIGPNQWRNLFLAAWQARLFHSQLCELQTPVCLVNCILSAWWNIGLSDETKGQRMKLTGKIQRAKRMTGIGLGTKVSSCLHSCTINQNCGVEEMQHDQGSRNKARIRLDTWDYV